MSGTLVEADSAETAEREPTLGTTLVRSSVRKWLPLTLLVLLTASLAFRTAGLRDPDTWWHLRLGEEFRGNWSLADPGQLSPFATRPWYATQWTLNVAASYVEQLLGLEGVAWLVGAGVVALGLAVYLACRREANALPAVLATGIALVGASGGLSARPQLASFVLISVVLAAWLRTEQDLRPRWWLVPLSWLWACTHGLWFVGIVIGLAVVAGLWLDRRVTWRQMGRLLAVPVLSVVAAALTPVGPKLILAPLGTSAMAPFVTEHQPPDISDQYTAATALMLGLVVLTWARKGSVPWPRLLLLVVAAGWTLLMGRTVAIGAVMVAPLLASAVQSWLAAREVDRPSVGERRFLGFGLVACLVALAVAVPSLPKWGILPPTRLDATLASLPDGTVVYNAYELGGWLEWEHRNVAPVVDGMTRAYHVEHMAAVVNAFRLGKGWHQFVRDTGAEYALVEVDSPLALELENHLDWKQIGVDDHAGYLMLRAPQN
jgi:hypothetical protein